VVVIPPNAYDCTPSAKAEEIAGVAGAILYCVEP
jgi:hypothetical protein